MSRDKDAIINSLSAALKEALDWGCIEGKNPPYRVPYTIQYDLWKWTTAEDKQTAYKIIAEAVDKAAGNS